MTSDTSDNDNDNDEKTTFSLDTRSSSDRRSNSERRKAERRKKVGSTDLDRRNGEDRRSGAVRRDEADRRSEQKDPFAPGEAERIRAMVLSPTGVAVCPRCNGHLLLGPNTATSGGATRKVHCASCKGHTTLQDLPRE